MNIRVIRNWLNILFIIGAIIGMYVFYKGDRTIGTYIIIVSIIIKFTESALRMLKKDE